MKAFTFIVKAAVTIHADTEEEARKDLLECCEDEDTYIGPGGVYLATCHLENAELEEVYDPDEDGLPPG